MRNQRGNLYVLYVALAALLIGAFAMGSSLCLKSVSDFRLRSALEAASLAAANDLSRIVINDPYWGFVSLTDHPPIGLDTMARDEEPLPVTGINTILGTARLEMIVAKSIGTNEALDAAREDLRAAREAQRRLERALAASINPASRAIARDFNGVEVKPLETAKLVYMKNITALCDMYKLQLVAFSGSLGWLEGGSTTNTIAPRPYDLTEIDDHGAASGKYRAFVDVPYDGQSFYFAGLSEQSSLADPGAFRSPDDRHMCSIVRLTARFSRSPDDSADVPSSFDFVACAQPFYMEDKTRAPIMALSFPNGLPSRIQSLRQLLTSDRLGLRVPNYSAAGGDYPVDRKAQLVSDVEQPLLTVRQAITRGYFDWLRAAHVKPRVDSLINNLDCRFACGHDESLANLQLYGFDGQGRLTVLNPKRLPFSQQTTYENQFYSLAFNAIQSDSTGWTIRLRDQVRRLGTINGGKHAGQPMPSLEYIDELTQLSGIEPSRRDELRLSDSRSRSRYDVSRLALEIEVSSPQNLALSTGAVE